MKKLNKVVFIGGLTNGKIVFDYLIKNKYVDLALTLTYPDDTDESGRVKFPDGDRIVKSHSVNNFVDKIIEIKPDFIFVAGWSELLSNDIINASKHGTYGFHPSKLPSDRGRSVLAWQIEDGYSQTALTLFKYSDYPDGGDIAAQEIIRIEFNDYISDVLSKIDIATENIMKAYFPLIRKGLAQEKQQDLSVGNFRRLRNNKDSLINWDTNSVVIYNKIRAISKPYPGAIADIEGLLIRVWRSNILTDFEFGLQCKAGTVVARMFDNSMIVRTRDSFIQIIIWENLK
jgi:methionyl-tRNA formyltransferase